MLLTTWSFLTAWYNLPFLTLIGLCVVLAAMQLIGLGGGSDSDSDHSLGHEADLDHAVDLDHDVSIDHDVSVEHGVDVDHDLSLEHDASLDHEVNLEHDASLDHDLDHDLSHDIDHSVDHAVDHGTDYETGYGADHGGLSTLSLLAFVGVGKIPLMVVLLILFAAIGLIGLGLNSLIRSLLGGYPQLLFLGVLPVAVVAGSIVSSRLARFIGHALPPVSTTASRAQTLVGRRGAVTSPFVDERYGLVHLRDSGGTLISIFAINTTGQDIQRGDIVVLTSYDTARKIYSVVKVVETTFGSREQ